MDVQLIASSVFSLPSSQRVDAIVHDGTTDLRPWPRPGPDRDLMEHYGPELSHVLERERERLPGGDMPIGEMLRLHRGNLHCDFLLWVASRPPEVKGVRAPAPAAEILEAAVRDALAFAADRHVSRVAFGTLGEGPDEIDEVARLVLIARAANAYYDTRYQKGLSADIEEVLICHPSSSRVSAARRELGRAVKVIAEPKPVATEEKPKRRVASKSTATGTRKTTRKTKPVLADEDVGRARATAGPYDRAKTYLTGDFFVHSKFGVGRVEEITAEGFIQVLFEGGETRRLLHARP